MQLYVVECHVGLPGTEGHKFIRTWKTSQGDASKERTRLMGEHGLKRADIEVTAVEVDVRKEGLIKFLNTLGEKNLAVLGDYKP